MTTPTIIISNDYTITDFTKINNYYINNSERNIVITLGVPKSKFNLHFYLMNIDGYQCSIYIQKGYYFLTGDNPNLHLVYDGKWQAIGDSPIPFVDETPKQQFEFNQFENSETGKDFLIWKGFTGTNTGFGSSLDTTEIKYKIDKDLIFLSSPNYQVTDTETKNGVGAVIVYEYKNNNSALYHSLITQAYNNSSQLQGNFSTHIKILTMANYDLLIVSAPASFKIYVYSFRKNKFDEFYFHYEFQTQYSGTTQLKIIQPIQNYGFLYYSNQMYIFDLASRSHTYISSLSKDLINFELLNNTLFIADVSNNVQKYAVSFPSSITLSKNIQTVNDTNFGKQIQINKINQTTISSNKILITLDASDNEIFRKTFNDNILSFDVYTDASNNNHYLVLLDSTLINVFLIENNTIKMSDYFIESNQPPSKIKFNQDGQSFFLSYPTININDVELGDIEKMGYIIRYDLYLDSQQTLSNTFPIFNISNELLVDEFNSNNVFSQRFLETNFLDTSTNSIGLVSNKNKSNYTVEKMVPVENDTGLLLMLKTENIANLIDYPIYCIYSDLSDSYIVNQNNKFLSINSVDKYKYIKPFVNPKTEILSDYYDTVVIKNGNNIQQFFLSMSQNNKWNLIRYTLSTKIEFNINRNNIPTVIIKEDAIEEASSEIPFAFSHYVYSDQIIFIVQKIDQAIVLFYNLSNGSVTHKIFAIGNNHFFLADEFKNLFHYNGLLLKIFESSTGYTSSKNFTQELDLLDMDQLFIKYKNQNIYILHNQIQEDFNTIKYLTINSERISTTATPQSTITISNTNTNKNKVLAFNLSNGQTSLIVCNYEDIDKIFLHPNGKIYKLPHIVNTQWTDISKLSTGRMLYNVEKEFLNAEKYNINTISPKQFYNSTYSQFFRNETNTQPPFPIFNRYYFYDNRKSIQVDKNIYILFRNDTTMRKMVVPVSNGYRIEKYAFDSSRNVIGFIEKSSASVSNYSFKIYDLNQVETKIYQTDFSNNNICAQTLAVYAGTFSVSEKISAQNNAFAFKLHKFEPSLATYTKSTLQLNDITTTIDGCLYQSPDLKYLVLDKVQTVDESSTVSYWRLDNGIYESKTFTSNQLSDDIQIEFPNDLCWIINDNKKSIAYMYSTNAMNQNVNPYMGESISKISEIKTFEIQQTYFVDLFNQADFLSSNVTISSPLFYGIIPNNKVFYYKLDNRIFRIGYLNNNTPYGYLGIMQLIDNLNFNNDTNTNILFIDKTGKTIQYYINEYPVMTYQNNSTSLTNNSIIYSFTQHVAKQLKNIFEYDANTMTFFGDTNSYIPDPRSVNDFIFDSVAYEEMYSRSAYSQTKKYNLFPNVDFNPDNYLTKSKVFFDKYDSNKMYYQQGTSLYYYNKSSNQKYTLVDVLSNNIKDFDSDFDTSNNVMYFTYNLENDGILYHSKLENGQNFNVFRYDKHNISNTNFTAKILTIPNFVNFFDANQNILINAIVYYDAFTGGLYVNRHAPSIPINIQSEFNKEIQIDTNVDIDSNFLLQKIPRRVVLDPIRYYGHYLVLYTKKTANGSLFNYSIYINSIQENVDLPNISSPPIFTISSIKSMKLLKTLYNQDILYLFYLFTDSSNVSTLRLVKYDLNGYVSWATDENNDNKLNYITFNALTGRPKLYKFREISQFSNPITTVPQSIGLPNKYDIVFSNDNLYSFYIAVSGFTTNQDVYYYGLSNIEPTVSLVNGEYEPVNPEQPTYVTRKVFNPKIIYQPNADANIKLYFDNNKVISNIIYQPDSTTTNLEITQFGFLGEYYKIMKFNDNIYTMLDDTSFVAQNKVSKTARVFRNTATNKNVNINYNAGPIYDYKKSVYYLTDLSLNKLDASNNNSVIDLSYSTYFTFDIDADETIRVSEDKINNVFFKSFYYNEVYYGQEILRIDDFYSYAKNEGFASLSLDGNKLLYIDLKTKVVYLMNRTLDNNFDLKQTFIPDSNILKYVSLNDKFSAIRVDWINKLIYFGLASTDVNGKGKVIIGKWNESQTNYILEQVLESVLNSTSSSFGTSIDVSPFGDIVAIGEPLAPAQGVDYKQGIVHVYTRINSSLSWTNELRSKESSVGSIVKLSSSQNQLATIGIANNVTEFPKITVFRSILLPVKRYITLPYNVPDIEFFGKDAIMTSNEIVDQKSVLHWIQRVNECFEIVTTRDITHNSIVNQLNDIYDICSVRNKYAMLIRKKRNNANEYKESSIELYKVEDDLNLIASIDLKNNNIQLFSNVGCSYDGSTLVYQTYNSGKFNFYFYY